MSAPPDASDYIIMASPNRPVWVRVRDHALTVLLWLVYAYLMQDFFIFAQQAFTWATAGGARPEAARSAMAVLGTVLAYAGVMALNGAAFSGWALYNRLRFRGRERRKEVPPLEHEELARGYGVAVEDVAEWSNARIATVHHDPDGRIAQVDVKRWMGE